MKTEFGLGLILCLVCGCSPVAPPNYINLPAPPTPIDVPPHTICEILKPSPSPILVVTPPNPQLKVGVMAIVPTQTKTSLTRAASLASFAGRRFKPNSAWRAMQVFVFADNKSATRFKDYQLARRNQSLESADYQALQAIWPHTLAVYRINGSRESIYYPSKAPKTWWIGQ